MKSYGGIGAYVGLGPILHRNELRPASQSGDLRQPSQYLHIHHCLLVASAHHDGLWQEWRVHDLADVAVVSVFDRIRGELREILRVHPDCLESPPLPEDGREHPHLGAEASFGMGPIEFLRKIVARILGARSKLELGRQKVDEWVVPCWQPTVHGPVHWTKLTEFRTGARRRAALACPEIGRCLRNDAAGKRERGEYPVQQMFHLREAPHPTGRPLR